MFWKNWSWPTRIFSIIGLVLIAAILFPVFVRPQRGSQIWSCQSNLKQIGLGIAQYTQDYDDKFPLVEVSGSAYGWADALQPYLKSTQLYQCPMEPTPGQPNPHENAYTDYPFNKRMGGTLAGKIKEPAVQVLVLDGNAEWDDTNARYSFTQIPPEWRANSASPLYRHNGMANYLFADGHVKALYPPQVEDVERTRAEF